METNARRDGVRNDWLAYPARQPRNTNTSAYRKRRAQLMAGNPVCKVCGQRPAVELDHRVAVCLGGSDDEANLQPICKPCHRSKSGHEANVVRWIINRQHMDRGHAK